MQKMQICRAVIKRTATEASARKIFYYYIIIQTNHAGFAVAESIVVAALNEVEKSIKWPVMKADA